MAHAWTRLIPNALAKPYNFNHFSLVVRLTIERNSESGKFYIAQQDDYYHPEELANLVISRLGPLIYAGKRAGSIASNLGAWTFKRVFGWWNPISTVGTRKA